VYHHRLALRQLRLCVYAAGPSWWYHRRLVLQQPEKQRLALKDVVAGDVFAHGLKHLVRVVAQ
jgi:anti-sigma factor RsiW